jgi:hypothetical protein
MRFAKAFVMVVFAVVLETYVVDCVAMDTPEQAMQCCDTMPCSHGHDQADDCCKSMFAMHAPFMQPSAHTFSISLVFVAVTPVLSQAHSLEFALGVIAAHSHAPPFSHASNLSLRI